MALVALLLSGCVDSGGARPEVVSWERPSAFPDRVILTLSDSPATTQSVTWRTDSSIGESFAEIAVADGSPDLAALASRVEASTEVVRLQRSEYNAGLDTDLVYYHSVTFRDLSAATLYAYRVGRPGRWSEWHHFHTASGGEEPFRFLYFGDAQNGVLSHWSRVLRSAYRAAPDAAFAIHAGDLVNAGHSDLEWAEWYRAGGWLHATLPSLAVPGNHEYRALDRARRGERILSLQWRAQFTLPVVGDLPERLAETAYAIDYEGSRFFFLDSNRDQEEQARWLDGALERTEANWVIATFHHPIFSNTAERDNPELRDLWKPIFDRHGVDLVLQGHDHTYSRGHAPGSADAAAAPEGGAAAEPGPARLTSAGTVYVVSVSGAKQYELGEDLWVGFRELIELDDAAENTQFYQIVDVEPGRLVYRAYTAAGELYDGFTLSRDANGEKAIADLPEATRQRRLYENTAPYESGHWAR